MSTLETNLIQPSTGTTLTLGASGDTITVPSGVTIAGGLANTPAFYVTPSVDQTGLTDNVLTQINFGQKNFDTDNAFSSNTFTVPSGKGGKYFFSVTLFIQSDGQALNSCEVYFYVNGSQNIYTNTEENPHITAGLFHSGVLNLSAGDTVKVYARVDVNNNGTYDINQDNPAGTSRCWWIGYRLIT